MDLVTQALAGAAAAQSCSNAKLQRQAALCGAIAGMAPDLDALISSTSDPLLNLDYHRHFSHALAFIPFGATAVTLCLWTLSLGRLPFRRTWLMCLVGYATHGLLDACTSYGTHLFWPFSMERVSWSLVSIIDPIFSLPLLLLVISGFRHYRPWAPRLGTLVCLSYLAFSAQQHHSAQIAQSELMAARGHSSAQVTVKPSFGNVVLHRSVYLHNGIFYIDAIHILPGLESRIYPGSGIAKFDLAETYPEIEQSSGLLRDFNRFQAFSKGYTSLHPQLESVIGDIRFSMIPTSAVPLWGIKINPETPDPPIEFLQHREMNRDDLTSFWKMLFRQIPDDSLSDIL
ncbi:MAG: metal-dependent hydrolase [Myxococcota bacterium]|nr:metal-dependent hydrolase [Myxococcota bacterium]